MSQSCRNAVCKCYDRRGENYSLSGTNAGLIRDRYLRLSANDADRTKARGELLEAIRLAITQLNGIYKPAFSRNRNSLPQPVVGESFRTIGRMVIGLGGENVLETGLSLQHTYGTPLILGSAMKGIAAHYCDQVWGVIDPKFKLGGEHYVTIFGTTEDSGHIIFHDAWITPESLADSLKPDVMTPHHGDYYSKKDGAAPTDFDDPNPITFLSIAGIFHVAVSCDVPNEEGEKWAKLIFKMLTEALKEWGIGGKTNAGYGRMEATAGTTIEATSREQVAVKVAELIVRRPMHKKGDVVEVTRDADPNVRRGKPYFRAADDFGGFVQFGNAPSLEIGQKTRLEIAGVMNEGYVFAVTGSKEDHIRNKNKGGRR